MQTITDELIQEIEEPQMNADERRFIIPVSTTSMTQICESSLSDRIVISGA